MTAGGNMCNEKLRVNGGVKSKRRGRAKNRRSVKIQSVNGKILTVILLYALGTLIPLSVGALSVFLVRDQMQIYAAINLPPLSPRGIAFPIVWTVLYFLMGISSVTVYRLRDANPVAARLGLSRYFSSLFFNLLWSIIFFDLRSPLFAFFTILVLLYFVVGSAVAYLRVSVLAGCLQIPYILWIVFAAYLNVGVYFLN